jgi:hypothetical protein
LDRINRIDRIKKERTPVILTLKTKMPLRVCATMLLLNRDMHVQSARVEPNATSNPKWLRFWNLSQAQTTDVKRTGNVFTAFGVIQLDLPEHLPPSTPGDSPTTTRP